MLKQLAILSVLLAIAPAGFPAPRVVSNPKTGASNHKTHADKSYAETTPAPGIPEKNDSPTFIYNGDKQKDKDGWDKAAVFSNYLLALIGIVGIVAAICTLLKLERQTKAGEDAATAALKQAKHSTASERPWVTVRHMLEIISRTALFSMQ